MIHFRLMTPRNVPLGMRLKEQAGWNQTDHRMLFPLELRSKGRRPPRQTRFEMTAKTFSGCGDDVRRQGG
jgi:hypothetical protein